MELKISTAQILKVLHVLSWIIFIGLCINAGAILFNTVYVNAINSVAVHRFWQNLDFSGLWKFDHGYFYVIVIQMLIIEVLKALLFYQIIKVFLSKKMDFTKPFTLDLHRLLKHMTSIILGISLFTYWGEKNTTMLVKKGVIMPQIHQLNFASWDVWLFIGVILFIVAQWFKKGIELQQENDLTI